MDRHWLGTDINSKLVEFAETCIAAATEPMTDEESMIGSHWRPRDPDAPLGSKPKTREGYERKHKSQHFGWNVDD